MTSCFYRQFGINFTFTFTFTIKQVCDLCTTVHTSKSNIIRFSKQIPPSFALASPSNVCVTFRATIIIKKRKKQSATTNICKKLNSLHNKQNHPYLRITILFLLSPPPPTLHGPERKKKKRKKTKTKPRQSTARVAVTVATTATSTTTTSTGKGDCIVHLLHVGKR